MAHEAPLSSMTSPQGRRSSCDPGPQPTTLSQDPGGAIDGVRWPLSKYSSVFIAIAARLGPMYIHAYQGNTLFLASFHMSKCQRALGFAIRLKGRSLNARWSTLYGLGNYETLANKSTHRRGVLAFSAPLPPSSMNRTSWSLVLRITSISVGIYE